jgi:hypothetical protein
MLSRSLLRGAAALLLAVTAGAALAQARIEPPDPVQFERIALRQTVDDCMFDPAAVDVSVDRGTIVVVQPPRQCFAPGNPIVVDLQLGAFPRGDYRVEIRHALDGPTLERVDFSVQGLVLPAVFPPPPQPLANYTGIWWTPSESGWGLSLHQSRVHALFGALYVFGPDGRSRWYTLGSGQWQSPTRWRGQMFESHGPFWASPGWDASTVRHDAVGTVEFDFTLQPGLPGSARMTYSIGGTTVSETISRIRF